jgi:nucleoside-diphosphate-sugar epimerase
MIVAIIGANGFVGTRLVEMFHLGDRHVVVPVVRRPSALALCARFDLPARIADALDVSALAAALAGCDAVVHVALGDPRQIEDMPAVLCAAAAAARVPRVVYLSSAAVHGPAPSPATTEASPLHTRHAMDYNNAKVRAERVFFRAAARHGLAGFALRPGIVFGPRSRWIADLADDLRGRRAWLLGEGGGLCNTLYVDNLVEAVACCLLAPSGAAGAYLVGDAERVTWADLYHGVARSLGVAPPAFHRAPAERLARILAAPLAQAALPMIPSRLKRFGKRLATALIVPAAGPGAWSLPAAPGPRITQELALLQQNTWRLPSSLAGRRLAYHPPVAFPAGLARSLAWLDFAEGRR